MKKDKVISLKTIYESTQCLSLNDEFSLNDISSANSEYD